MSTLNSSFKFKKVENNYWKLKFFLTLLIADAVLNAIGLTSYELADQVDFNSWFTSTLAPLASQSHSKILKRRVSWLIAQWVCVKFSAELRPTLYQLLLESIKTSDDLVVRLEAALALKITIDDYSFDPNQFIGYQGWVFENKFEKF